MAIADPEQLERLVARLRVHFTPQAVLLAREIEQRLYEETWLQSRVRPPPSVARSRGPDSGPPRRPRLHSDRRCEAHRVRDAARATRRAAGLRALRVPRAPGGGARAGDGILGRDLRTSGRDLARPSRRRRPHRHDHPRLARQPQRALAAAARRARHRVARRTRRQRSARHRAHCDRDDVLLRRRPLGRDVSGREGRAVRRDPQHVVDVSEDRHRPTERPRARGWIRSRRRGRHRRCTDQRVVSRSARCGSASHLR